MRIDQPREVTRFPGTTVHNGVKAAAWADLDLSAVVGARKAVVTLRCQKDATAGVDYLWFRQNGVATSVGGAGVTLIAADGSEHGYAEVLTDALGLVEWLSSDAVPVWTVTVEAFSYE